MAKTRNWLADLLGRTAQRVFTFISRHEDRSRLIKWIKLPLLGTILSTIGWLSIGISFGRITCCYAPVITEPYIKDARVTPNPTAGADSVTVNATAIIEDERPDDEEAYIEGARVSIDSLTTDMDAIDGNFDEKEEELKASVYVGELEPGSTKVYVEVFNNQGEMDDEIIDLEITEG